MVSTAVLADAPGPEEPSNAKYGIDPGVVLYTHCPADTDPPIRSGLSEMMSEVATFSADCIIRHTKPTCASLSTTPTPLASSPPRSTIGTPSIRGHRTICEKSYANQKLCESAGFANVRFRTKLRAHAFRAVQAFINLFQSRSQRQSASGMLVFAMCFIRRPASVPTLTLVARGPPFPGWWWRKRSRRRALGRHCGAPGIAGWQRPTRPRF